MKTKQKSKRLNLCSARAKKGLNQGEVAELLGISRKWYGKKELGYKDFTETEIEILIKFFNQTYEDLIQREN